MISVSKQRNSIMIENKVYNSKCLQFVLILINCRFVLEHVLLHFLYHLNNIQVLLLLIIKITIDKNCVRYFHQRFYKTTLYEIVGESSQVVHLKGIHNFFHFSDTTNCSESFGLIDTRVAFQSHWYDREFECYVTEMKFRVSVKGDFEEGYLFDIMYTIVIK